MTLMALKYREEVVGKRFLALKTTSKSSKNIADREWISGIIRAASDKELQSKDFQVLVEFDNTDWEKRDWLKVNEDYSAFLVERTLVLAQRDHPEKTAKRCWWPALTFQSIVDKIGLAKSQEQPLEFLVDQNLVFLDKDSTTDYAENRRSLDSQSREAANQWFSYQDGQCVLVTTPTVLVGYRVRVYRSEGTTQWYTAVIQQYNNTTKEFTLLDDTVLEEHYESAELTQIIPLDGVVESILTGSDTRLTSTRRSRSCKESGKDSSSSSNPNQTQHTLATVNQAASGNQVNTRSSRQQVQSNGLKVTAKQNANGKTLVGKVKSSQSVEVTDKAGASHDTKKVQQSVVKRIQRSSDKKHKASPDNCKSTDTGRQDRVQRRGAKRSVSETKSAKFDSSDSEAVTDTSDNVKTLGQVDVTDMHYKKIRILGANSDSNPEHSPAIANNAQDDLPAKNSDISPTHPDKSNRIDKLSESSVDGCSSGYSSATTTDTVSPRTIESQRSSHSVPPIMTSQTNSANPTQVSHPIKAPTASPVTAKTKQSSTANANSTSSPLAVDTSVKESPIVPYRDPELLKRDEEVRKLQQMTSSTLPLSFANIATLQQQQQQQQQALMNSPTLAAQQLSMLQMSHLQLMDHYRHMQAMQLNPLHLSILQQQQLAAAHQTPYLEALYRQRTNLPTAPWMMVPPFSDKILGEREDRQALDQKDRERIERERLEKERAEKEREQKERRQMQESQERAKILEESAAAAARAVNQHFTESLRRAEQSRVTAAHPAPAAGHWNKKQVSEGSQPQDLSCKNKTDRDLSQERETREGAHRFGQTSTNHQHIDDKHKAINRQHNAFLRSVQNADQAKLAEEHFRKAAAQMQPKQESAEYSLYGYQSFPNRFVTKDQLQQQLCKDDNNEQKSPLLASSKRETTNQSHHHVGLTNTHPVIRQTGDYIKKEDRSASTATSSMSYSNHLIQDGLIPNPVYAHSNHMGLSTSSSISALVNMSMSAGSSLADMSAGGSLVDKQKNCQPTDHSPVIKSEAVAPQPGVFNRNTLPQHSNPGDGRGLLDTPPGQMKIKSFKSFVETAVTNAFYKDIEEQKKKSSPEMPSTIPAVKAERSNGTMDTDSDTLSAPSPTLSVGTNSQDGKPYHPKMKLKKEWAQRHCGEGSAPSSSPPMSGSQSGLNNSASSNQSETTTSASETEAEMHGTTKAKPKKRKSDTTSNSNQKKAKNYEVSSGGHKISRSSANMNGRKPRSPAAGGGGNYGNTDDEQNSIRQLAEVASAADRIDVSYASKPLVKASITTLKKTGQPFVQDGSCMEMAPKLTKCRECR